jgi:hypothetical protein
MGTRPRSKCPAPAVLIGLVSKRDCQTPKELPRPRRTGPGHCLVHQGSLPDSRTRPQIWPPVGANQSQCPAPLGQRTVFSRFGCVLLRRAKNLIAHPCSGQCRRSFPGCTRIASYSPKERRKTGEQLLWQRHNSDITRLGEIRLHRGRHDEPSKIRMPYGRDGDVVCSADSWQRRCRASVSDR